MISIFKKSMVSIIIITFAIAFTTFCSFAAAEGTIKVMSCGGPEFDYLGETIEKFEELSGIKVVYDTIPREILDQRLMAQLVEMKGDYDVVFNIGGGTWVTYVHKGNYIPIEDYLDKDLVEKIYARKNYTDPRTGKVAGIPMFHNYTMLFYRKDLFNDPKEKSAFKEKYGRELTVPVTLDELVETAEFFHRPPEMYGYCINGTSHSSFASYYSHFLFANGENYGDKDGNLTLNTPAAIKSMETLVKLAKFFPPGWEAMSQFDANEVMLQDKLPLLVRYTYVWAEFMKQPDKFGMATPAGVLKPGQGISGFLALIPKKAPNPDGAAEFLKWLASYDFQKSVMLAFPTFLAMRSDVLEDPEVLEKVIGLDQINKAVAESGGGQAPRCTWAPELDEAIYNLFYDIYTGKTTAEEGLNWLQNVKFAGRRAIE